MESRRPTSIIFGRTILGREDLFEGFHKPTQQNIIIKQYIFPELSKLEQGLKEQFCQAKLRHKHFCDIIDVTCQATPAGFELCLCLEKLEKDLQMEIEAKKGSYTEEELWQFLRCTVEAMALAQAQVSPLLRTSPTETSSPAIFS